MIQRFSNNAISLLASPLSAHGTSLTVLPGTGALYPALANDGSDYFLITLENQEATTREIIRVTGRTGDTLFGITRGLEGTTPRSWSASSGADTLVDHRITAGTMRLAMELPVPPVLPPFPPIGITVQDEGTSIGTLTRTMNFVGAGVSVTGSGDTKTVTIPGGAGTAWIEGGNTGPIVIIPNGTEIILSMPYSQYNRGAKVFVTSVLSNGLSETYEILTNISGNINSNATLKYTKYARVGDRISSTLIGALNTTTNTMNLSIENKESLNLEVMCTRISHSI